MYPAYAYRRRGRRRAIERAGRAAGDARMQKPKSLAGEIRNCDEGE